MTINPIGPQTIAPKITPAAPESTGGNPVGEVGSSFKQALDALSQDQQNSDDLVQKLAAGENVDLHQVMIASEETDINFRIAVAIRDRLVDAYRETMRMSV
jgi:flagellar hook-basal body complex protein FliE